LAELRAQDEEEATGQAVDEAEPDRKLEAMASLEMAYEELRVADEEVRAQYEQIGRLLQSQHVLHWQHERMLAMLPVPALVTDVNGLIRSVNAAAAVLTVRRAARLLGHPIFTLFDADDRPALRQLLADPEEAPRRRAARVVPREGDVLHVDVWLVRRSGDAAEATWLLFTPDDHPGRPGLEAVPVALTELTGLAGRADSVQQVLDNAADICRRTLGGVDVSLAVGRPDRPDAVASATRLAQVVDGGQVAAGEGPCLTAFDSRSVVTSQDLGADARWPRLARFLPDDRLSAVVAPVEVGERLMGTLNVYRPDQPLEPWVQEVAELLATTVGAVFHELELNAELSQLNLDMQRALATRAMIEQAKGIIMAQKGCGPDEAFALLKELSSAQERKLRDVAREIVEQASGS
jgi:PAS domain S-box-containing protein